MQLDLASSRWRPSEFGVIISEFHAGSARHLRLLETETPTGRRALLHSRQGGSQDDLVQRYDSASPGQLSNMLGQPTQGTWMLRVADLDRRDEGTLRTWGVEIETA